MNTNNVEAVSFNRKVWRVFKREWLTVCSYCRLYIFYLFDFPQLQISIERRLNWWTDWNTYSKSFINAFLAASEMKESFQNDLRRMKKGKKWQQFWIFRDQGGIIVIRKDVNKNRVRRGFKKSWVWFLFSDSDVKSSRGMIEWCESGCSDRTDSPGQAQRGFCHGESRNKSLESHLVSENG